MELFITQRTKLNSATVILILPDMHFMFATLPRNKIVNVSFN